MLARARRLAEISARARILRPRIAPAVRFVVAPRGTFERSRTDSFGRFRVLAGPAFGGSGLLELFAE